MMDIVEDEDHKDDHHDHDHNDDTNSPTRAPSSTQAPSLLNSNSPVFSPVPFPSATQVPSSSNSNSNDDESHHKEGSGGCNEYCMIGIGVVLIAVILILLLGLLFLVRRNFVAIDQSRGVAVIGQPINIYPETILVGDPEYAGTGTGIFNGGFATANATATVTATTAIANRIGRRGRVGTGIGRREEQQPVMVEMGEVKPLYRARRWEYFFNEAGGGARVGSISNSSSSSSSGGAGGSGHSYQLSPEAVLVIDPDEQY
jgi:hypothetical protein